MKKQFVSLIKALVSLNYYPSLATTSLGGRQKLSIVTFHHIPDSQRKRLEHFLRFAARYFDFLPPRSLSSFFAGKIDSKRPQLLVTFDDGLYSSGPPILDLLDKYSIQAIYFVCQGLYSGQNWQKFIVDNLQAQAIPPHQIDPSWRPMRVNHFQQLLRHGHSLGVHTRSHIDLGASLSDSLLEREVVAPKYDLAAQIGTPIEYFAYPFGAVENIRPSALKLIGEHYSFCFSNVRGPNSPTTHPLALRRQNIDLSQPMRENKSIAMGGYDFLYKKRRAKLDSMVNSGQHEKV